MAQKEFVRKRGKNHNPHYVNNKDFYQALIEYRKSVSNSEQSGLTKPMVPRYIGECFIKIATHVTYKSNFLNYSYKDDMISDAVADCLNAILKFNPDRYDNPFAYFTSIVNNAMLRRISKEKRQVAIREKLLDGTEYDQVMNIDDSLLSGNSSEYNTIKNNITYRNN